MKDYCAECAMRLFNEKGHKLEGIGNPYSGNLIIIPNVDYIAYKKHNMKFSSYVDIITGLSFTGGLENLYILPYIRCNDLGCPVTDDIETRCSYYLSEDFKKYNFTNIMVLGNVVNKFLGRSIKDLNNTILVSKNKRFYAATYSPFIKFIDKEKYEQFKKDIKRWYNSVENNYYFNYNIIYD